MIQTPCPFALAVGALSWAPSSSRAAPPGASAVRPAGARPKPSFWPRCISRSTRTPTLRHRRRHIENTLWNLHAGGLLRRLSVSDLHAPLLLPPPSRLAPRGPPGASTSRRSDSPSSPRFPSSRGARHAGESFLGASRRACLSHPFSGFSLVECQPFALGLPFLTLFFWAVATSARRSPFPICAASDGGVLLPG